MICLVHAEAISEEFATSTLADVAALDTKSDLKDQSGSFEMQTDGSLSLNESQPLSPSKTSQEASKSGVYTEVRFEALEPSSELKGFALGILYFKTPGGERG